MEVKEGIQDIILHCVDCASEFRFTLGEQRYFASKGLSIPKRCPECRLRRKRTLIRDPEVWQ